MKCPFCQSDDDRVVDSRDTEDGAAVRRRRECNKCKKRFTTYERIEEVRIFVVKKDGARVPLNSDKIAAGIAKACEKRPVPATDMEAAERDIIQKIRERGENEIPAKEIGEYVMDRLKDLDKIAYIRFASVYREFKDVADFTDVVNAVNN